METEKYYHVYKNPPAIPILSRINLIHNIPFHFFKDHFNTSRLRLSLSSPRFSVTLRNMIFFFR